MVAAAAVLAAVLGGAQAVPAGAAASVAPVAGRAGASYGTPAGAPRPDRRARTRYEIMERAESWVAAEVPYSMTKYWRDGYRQDCSGYVSMAWGLSRNEWTGSLAAYGERIEADELRPGDMLLFHNERNPHLGSHVTLFGGWTDDAHTRYLAYEQIRPHTKKSDMPYPYRSNADRFVPYRFKDLLDGGGGDLLGDGGGDLPGDGGGGLPDGGGEGLGDGGEGLSGMENPIGMDMFKPRQ